MRALARALEGLASGLSRPRPHAPSFLPRTGPACRRSAVGWRRPQYPRTPMHQPAHAKRALHRPDRPPEARRHAPLRIAHSFGYSCAGTTRAIRDHDNVTKIYKDKGCCFYRPFLGCIWADPRSSRCSRRRRLASPTRAWSPRGRSYHVAGRSLDRPASLLCGPTARSFVLGAFFGSISRYPSFQSGFLAVGSAGLTS